MPSFQDNHKKITDRSAITEALGFINNKIHGCGFDFEVDTNNSGYISYREEEVPENSLIVLSSFDFSYYHDLELVFYDVLFTDLEPGDRWWDHWEKNQIELNPDYDGEGYEFYFNRGAHSDIKLIVRAKAFSYYFGTVFYYMRDSLLSPGQRVAWWVTR